MTSSQNCGIKDKVESVAYSFMNTVFTIANVDKYFAETAAKQALLKEFS
jgi:hypothetical protein